MIARPVTPNPWQINKTGSRQFTGKLLALLPWDRTIRDVKSIQARTVQFCVGHPYRKVAMNIDEVIQAVREGSSLAGQDLSGLDLSGQDLKNAQLQGANMSNCNLCKTDLRGSNLSNVNLYNADLRGARLRRANLTRANRMLAKIQKWALKGAYIAGPTAYTED